MTEPDGSVQHPESGLFFKSELRTGKSDGLCQFAVPDLSLSLGVNYSTAGQEWQLQFEFCCRHLPR